MFFSGSWDLVLASGLNYAFSLTYYEDSFQFNPRFHSNFCISVSSTINIFPMTNVNPSTSEASDVPSNGGTSAPAGNASHAEEVRLRVEGFKTLVDDVVEGRVPSRNFLHKLKDLGATAGEAKDYLNLLEQRLEQQRKELEPVDPADDGLPAPDQREQTPEGLTEVEIADFRARRSEAEAAARNRDEENRRKAAESTAWAILQAKLAQLRPPVHESPPVPGLSADVLAELFDIRRQSSSLTLPSSVLAIAPHLQDLSGSSMGNPHVEATWKLRRALTSEKTLDTLVDLLQIQPLHDPIPRSIWKAIAQDQYVDFEKLHASMDRGYDHNDEPCEFAGGFALVKKDASSA
jgi:hypothetical protein